MNQEVQIYIDNLIKRITEVIKRKDSNHILTSILVTGSFGRGEPTVCYTEEGIQLKSDVEIAIIHKRGNKKQLNLLMEEVESSFDEDVQLIPFQEKRMVKAQNHNYAFVEPRYKTLFTYDVFKGSYTVWGRDYIGDRKVDIGDVDPYEAKKIVANRIGEYVHSFDIGNMSKDDYRCQWKGKILLAIVSAWLLLNKEYESSYHFQYKKIEEDKIQIGYRFGSHFFDDYTKTFKYLREAGESYEVPDERLRSYVSVMNQVFADHELKRSKVNCLSKNVRSWAKYFRSGMKNGINFEDTILQGLIDCYTRNSPAIEHYAELWSKILYY